MIHRRIVVIAIVLIAIPFLCYPFCVVFNDSVFLGKSTACLSNVKQLAQAHLLYAADNDDRLVSSQKWMDEIFDYSKNEGCFHCLGLDQSKTDQYGYAMNAKMLGVKLDSLRAQRNEILVFDSVILDRNAVSNLVGLPDPPRHVKNSIAFADGHASRTVSWPKSDQ